MLIGIGATHYHDGFISLPRRVAALFASGQQGAWYDESDLSTIYQDSAGTTPGAIGQPEGLKLDKRLGLTLGNDVAVNGNFSLGTGWGLGAGWAIGGGTANATNAPTYVYQNNASIISGKVYSVTYTISGYVAGSIKAYAGATASFGHSVSANGTYTEYICAAINGGELGLLATGFTGSVDDISYREVTGNHAIQATAAARPVLGNTGGYNYSYFDGIDDSLTSATGGGGTTGFFLCQAIKPTGGAGAVRTIWSDAGTDTGYRVRINAANKLEFAASNGAPLATPVQAAATTSLTGGTGLAASTAYYYVVTAINALGETIKSNEQTVTTGAGDTNSNTISWAAVADATGYKIYRGTATGAENVYYAVGAVTSYIDTGAASTAGTPPVLGETAFVKLASTATVDAGTTSLITVYDDGVNLNVQIGSAAVESVARPVVSAGTAGFTMGKDNGAATGFFTGNLYPEVYRKDSGLTATDRLNVQAYCKSKAGL